MIASHFNSKACAISSKMFHVEQFAWTQADPSIVPRGTMGPSASSGSPAFASGRGSSLKCSTWNNGHLPGVGVGPPRLFHVEQLVLAHVSRGSVMIASHLRRTACDIISKLFHVEQLAWTQADPSIVPRGTRAPTTTSRPGLPPPKAPVLRNVPRGTMAQGRASPGLARHLGLRARGPGAPSSKCSTWNNCPWWWLGRPA